MNNPTPNWTPAPVFPQPAALQEADNGFDAGEILGLLWHRKWLIFTTILVFIVGGFLYVKELPRLYQAEAKLILESKDQNATGLEAFVPGISEDDTEMNSQIEVIKSRHLIGRVVDRLSLAEDPEFNITLREPSFISQMMSQVRSLNGVELDEYEPEPRKIAIDNLTSKVMVAVVPKTHVFRISIETWSPLKSVEIVNELSSAFVLDQVNAKLESSAQAAEWLGNKVTELAQELSEAETRSADFRSQTERVITEQDVARSNLNLKNARGRLESFIASQEKLSGSDVTTTDRDRLQINSLLENIASLEEIVSNQNKDLLQIRQLDREAKAAGVIYGHFVQRMNEIEVQTGLQESDIRILSEAVSRHTATKPKTKIYLAVSAFWGLILSAAYVLLRKLMDRSFKDPAKLQATFGIPVIGTIARAPTTSRRALLKYAVDHPSSSIMESIRDLRTTLMISNKSKSKLKDLPGEVIVVTSSVPAEGKTTSTILLAINTAALKKKVLLVECDLRRSTFKSYFGPQMELGLSHAIELGEMWEDAVWRESRTNVDVIFGGGSKDRNAGDIFASQEFADFILRVRACYDLILLDSPPVLPVPDARMIGKFCDKTIYVVSAAMTAQSTVAAGIRLFDVKPDGLVMTQLKRNSGYDGYGYGSEYYRN